MKGSIEYGVIFLWSCFMLTILIQLALVLTQIHKGHLFLNYVINMVEDYDGDLNLVNEHIETSTICQTCSTEFTKSNQRFEVKVSFPLTMPSLGINTTIRLLGFSALLDT